MWLKLVQQVKGCERYHTVISPSQCKIQYDNAAMFSYGSFKLERLLHIRILSI
jgi:hypothetical protein